jgi:hypothetical protein
MAIKAGDFVKVRVFGGQEKNRRIVRLNDRKALLTTSEEFEKAVAEGREPISIGFPLEDVEEMSKERATPLASG